MARTKAKAHAMEPNYIVMPLLALALASNLFLYMVSYTQASFDRQAVALPTIIETPKIVSMLNEQVDSVQADVTASFSQVAEVTKPVVVSFFGMENYHYGMAPIQPSSARVENVAQVPVIQVSGASDSQGAVLGIMLVNPEYAQ